MINIMHYLWAHHILQFCPKIDLHQLKFWIMSALFILIGISIFVAACFLAAFLWSVSNGQYEDDYTPSIRMLFEDEITAPINTPTI